MLPGRLRGLHLGFFVQRPKGATTGAALLRHRSPERRSGFVGATRAAHLETFPAGGRDLVLERCWKGEDFLEKTRIYELYLYE